MQCGVIVRRFFRLFFRSLFYRVFARFSGVFGVLFGAGNASKGGTGRRAASKGLRGGFRRRFGAAAGAPFSQKSRSRLHGSAIFAISPPSLADRSATAPVRGFSSFLRSFLVLQRVGILVEFLWM